MVEGVSGTAASVYDTISVVTDPTMLSATILYLYSLDVSEAVNVIVCSLNDGILFTDPASFSV